jgi:hypothetical protein
MNEDANTTPYQLFGASGYCASNKASMSIPDTDTADLEHLPVVRVKIFVRRYLSFAVSPPEPPIETRPHPRDRLLVHPVPRCAEVVAIPQ